MVVGQSQFHNGAGHDLAVPDDGAVGNGMHSQDGRLGRVQDGSAHEGGEVTAVGDGEGAPVHVVQC